MVYFHVNKFSIITALFLLQANFIEKRILRGTTWICMPFSDSSHFTYLVRGMWRRGAGTLVKQLLVVQ